MFSEMRENAVAKGIGGEVGASLETVLLDKASSR